MGIPAVSAQAASLIDRGEQEPINNSRAFLQLRALSLAYIANLLRTLRFQFRFWENKRLSREQELHPSSSWPQHADRMLWGLAMLVSPAGLHSAAVDGNWLALAAHFVFGQPSSHVKVAMRWC
jgi:hypothetical protein